MTVRYSRAEEVVARMPSPKIWADCPVLKFLTEPAYGFYLWDDFKNSVVDVALTDTDKLIVQGDINWWTISEGDATGDIAIQADDEGHLMLDQDGTDDDCTSIVAGDPACEPIRLPKKGERKRFWFETRIKVSTVTNTDLAWFVGFIESIPVSEAVPLGAAPTAPADYDYLGFFVAEADGNDLTIIYNEATSGTAQSDTGEITLVADTWVRVGFRLDVDTDKIHVYEDGVDQGADAEIDIDSANFPSDTDVQIFIGITSGALGANGDNLKIDWVRFAQEY